MSINRPCPWRKDKSHPRYGHQIGYEMCQLLADHEGSCQFPSGPEVKRWACFACSEKAGVGHADAVTHTFDEQCPTTGQGFNGLRMVLEDTVQQMTNDQLKEAAAGLAAIIATEPVEVVEHPQHYGGKDNPYEHVKIVNAVGLNYQLGCATKYIFRAGKKPGVDPIEDLKKAIKFVELEIQRIQGMEKT